MKDRLKPKAYSRTHAVAICPSPCGLTYHRFPMDSHVAKMWMVATRRDDKFNLEEARICEQHFSKDAYECDLRNELLQLLPWKKLKADAVPTELLLPKQTGSRIESTPRREQEHLSTLAGGFSSQSVGRAERALGREQLKMALATIAQAGEPSLEEAPEMFSDGREEPKNEAKKPAKSSKGTT